MKAEYFKRDCTVLYCSQQKLSTKFTQLSDTSIVSIYIQTYRVAQQMAHGVYGNNFIYSQSFFIIFGTCTL